MNEINKNYINELKSDHKIVGQLLEDIKFSIQAKDIQGIATRIDSLKKSLFGHLKKEDDKLYFDLRNKAKDKKNMEMIEMTVSTFSTAMKNIEARILRFLEKYPSKDEIAKVAADFNKDFQGVYEDIMKRVNNEEKVLYPMYEKYCC